MNPIKKMTKRIINDVKDTIKEEASKTGDEIKTEVLETTTDILPYACLFVGAIVLVCLAKRPTPVVVKLIVKAV